MCKRIIKKIALFTGLVSIVFFAFVSPVFAFTTKGGEDVSIAEDINDDLYVAGNTVIVSSVIDGDLVSSGGKLVIDGDVNEDLIAAGGIIDVMGKIGDDVRAAGGMVTIKGSIQDDLIIAGGTINITETAKIGGDLVITGGNITVGGEVTGKMIASGGNIIISGKIGEDVTIDEVTKLIIDSSAEINGDLVYQSSQKASIADGAKISGEVKFTEIEERVKTKAEKPTEFKSWQAMAPAGIFGWFFGVSLISSTISFLSLFVIGIILLKLIPVVFRKFNDRLKKTPGISVGAGAITIFGVPLGILIAWIIGLILVLTILGIGIAGLLFASTVIAIILYWILVYVSSIFIAYLIGELILSKSKQDLSKYGWQVLAFFIGLAILTLLNAIPILGGIVTFLTILFGVGGIGILLWDWMMVYKKKSKK
jgi:hypothetical protein